jgi:hypothetical protein
MSAQTRGLGPPASGAAPLRAAPLWSEARAHPVRSPRRCASTLGYRQEGLTKRCGAWGSRPSRVARPSRSLGRARGGRQSRGSALFSALPVWSLGPSPPVSGEGVSCQSLGAAHGRAGAEAAAHSGAHPTPGRDGCFRSGLRENPRRLRAHDAAARPGPSFFDSERREPRLGLRQPVTGLPEPTPLSPQAWSRSAGHGSTSSAPPGY